jgi:integrase
LKQFEYLTLSVQYTVHYMNGRIIEGEPKTAGSRRTIAMPDYTSQALENYQKATGNKEGLVYRTSSGRPVSGRNVTRHFHSALEKAGLPRMRFHDLRHTAATLLFKENVHPKVVQEMLGHSTIPLTLDTYSHILPDIQQEAGDKMDKNFGEV